MSTFLRLETLHIGAPDKPQWETTVLDLPRGISPKTAEHGAALIGQWADIFPREETWAMREHGVPSLLVRLDCVPALDKSELRCFEIEDRPQGLGISLRLNQQLFHRFEKVRENWPKRIISVSAPERRGGDDYLWATEVTLEGALREREAIVVTRCEPHQEQFWELAGRAMSPVKAEGDKSYGEKLGWWGLVADSEASSYRSWQGKRELPGLGEGYCLKPLHGSKCQDILIVHPECGPGASGHKKTGASGRRIGGYSRNQAVAHLREKGMLYCQPFIPPIEAEIGQLGPYNHMYRIYYAFDPATRQWVCLGGVWFARPCPQLLLHGAKDAIVGPVVLL